MSCKPLYKPHTTAPMKITAIGTNVLLKLNDRKLKTAGGIELLEAYSKAEDEGEVINFGSGVEDIKEGDFVGFPTHCGTRFTFSSGEYLIIPCDKLIYVRA